MLLLSSIAFDDDHFQSSSVACTQMVEQAYLFTHIFCRISGRVCYYIMQALMLTSVSTSHSPTSGRRCFKTRHRTTCGKKMPNVHDLVHIIASGCSCYNVRSHVLFTNHKHRNWNCIVHPCPPATMSTLAQRLSQFEVVFSFSLARLLSHLAHSEFWPGKLGNLGNSKEIWPETKEIWLVKVRPWQIWSI